jgi:hypothetical protein
MRTLLLCLAIGASCAIGCGSGAPDVGPNGKPSTTYPAAHPALPKVITYGGPILASPKLYAVTFGNDGDQVLTNALADFVQRVGGTAYFSANLSEYGVGPATAGLPIALAESAPATIDDSVIQTWLAAKLNADDPAFPLQPDGQTLFILFYPAGTTITVNGGQQQACIDFGGYHSSTTLDPTHGNAVVPYAVVPRCPGSNGFTDLDVATVIASSQLLGAVTDPDPLNNPAWAFVDDNHVAWALAVGGGETWSLCAQEETSFVKLTEIPYMVQRGWSNASAAVGHDPCVPATPGQAYFNAIAVLPDALLIGGKTTQGVKIPNGGSRTIVVDLYSDAATTGSITVSAFDYFEALGGSPALSFSFDSKSGLNGQHLNLTISVLRALPIPEPFFLQSTVGSVSHLSVGLVGN